MPSSVHQSQTTCSFKKVLGALFVFVLFFKRGGAPVKDVRKILVKGDWENVLPVENNSPFCLGLVNGYLL